MQDSFDTQTNKVGQCAVCGKPVPKRDVRDKGALYCGRVHAGLARFGARYQGTNSGPLDRPVDIMGKTKFDQS